MFLLFNSSIGSIALEGIAAVNEAKTREKLNLVKVYHSNKNNSIKLKILETCLGILTW